MIKVGSKIKLSNKYFEYATSNIPHIASNIDYYKSLRGVVIESSVDTKYTAGNIKVKWGNANFRLFIFQDHLQLSNKDILKYVI